MKVTPITTPQEIPYDKISKEGWYLSKPWTILFLKDDDGKIAPAIAYKKSLNKAYRIPQKNNWHFHSFTYLPDFSIQI